MFALDTGLTILVPYCSGGLRRSPRDRSGSTVIIVLLLALWLLEPLACMTYCRNWSLLQLHNAFAARHQDQQLLSKPTALDELTSELAHLRPVVLPNLFLCFMDPMHGTPSDAPSTPSAAVFHVHLAILAISMLLMLMFVIQHYRSTFAPMPPQRALSPLLRPPIASAC